MTTKHNNDSVKSRAIESLERSIGFTILNALKHPKTVEVMLNADGNVWLEQLGGASMQLLTTLSSSQAESFIKTVASVHGLVVNAKNPIIECELPIDGSRFAGQLPPIVEAPTFAIRKRAIHVFTLSDYVESSIMTLQQKTILETAIIQHKNILIVGGTGSGKTTLVNAIIQEMVAQFTNERVFIIEDTGEIQCAAKNHVQYHTTPDVNMTRLLKTTLRMRPDRILVGEVRGPEALDLLMAWNTGHEGGCATLHANNALAGLSRLAMLISMNQDAPRNIEPLIGEVVHFVVFIARTPNGHRKIHDIIQINGFEGGRYLTQSLA